MPLVVLRLVLCIYKYFTVNVGYLSLLYWLLILSGFTSGPVEELWKKDAVSSDSVKKIEVGF